MRVARRPYVNERGLCLQANAVRNDWHLSENPKIGQFTTGGSFSSQTRVGSHWAHVTDVTVWRRCGERYAAFDILQHDWFGGGPVMVWGGFSLEGPMALHVLARDALTDIRYRGEILRPFCETHNVVEWAVDSFCCRTMLGFIWLKCQQVLHDEGIDAVDWPAHSQRH